jgi:hypothetical protein
MVKRFLNVPPFLNFKLSSPSGIATCTALHAIRRYAGNIASGALILTNTLYYCIFSEFFFCFQRDS